MSSPLYRSFLRVLEKWPIDPSKKGRDLGEYIRICVAEAYKTSESRDTSTCAEVQESLARIASDRYREAFFVSKPGSASGLSQTECQQAISNEFLQLAQEEEKGKLKKLKERIFSKED